MDDYVERWYKSITAQSPTSIHKQGDAWGECERHTGPSYWYAKVRISLGPSSELRVVDKLDSAKSTRLRDQGWFDEIVFGVLDVMLTHQASPTRHFELAILDADIHEVDSRAVAFRLAARDATAKILAQLG